MVKGQMSFVEEELNASVHKFKQRKLQTLNVVTKQLTMGARNARNTNRGHHLGDVLVAKYV